MANEDEGLPESVQAEVDAIKRQEGIGGTTDDGKYTEETEQVAAPPPAAPKSRRAQEREEEAKRISAAEDRAAKAEQAIETLRRESAERHARLEGLLEAGNQHRQQQPVYVERAPAPAPPPKDFQAEILAAKRAGQKALADGKYDEWDDHQTRANALQAEEMFNRRMQDFEQRQPRQQQQIPEKPIWLTAVENQFLDVLQHQRGPGTVAAFMQMEGIGPQTFNAENMQKAFARARKELNLAPASSTPTEQQRQVHAGGPVNGSSRPSGSGGNGKQVKVPKNWRQIARQAGMTEAQYLRGAKDME